ncbi:MAG: penicillin-binding protein 2 [Candidatus Pacebacteria bacterium]|nr:penicillin-binding protein 2 [Candidatus Paceibacterota bacterium]
MRKEPEIPFEDSLNDDWSRDLNMVEVPLGSRPFWALGAVVLAVVAVVFFRIAYLDLFNGAYFAARAADNASQSQASPAPRGIIYDKEGNALVENKAVFTAELNARAFLADGSLQSSTLDAAQSILGVPSSTLWTMLESSSQEDFATPVVLSEDLDQTQLVNLQALSLPTIKIGSDFSRYYPDGQVFASVIGYTGRVSQGNLTADPELTADDFIGKTGIEKQYDTALRGIPGVNIRFTNAEGQMLGQKQQSAPTIGSSVNLTIDGGLQTYLYNRTKQGLAALGRQVGVGIALDPRTGAVLALVNLPGYDNNLFSDPSPSSTAQIKDLLTSSVEPMFDRAVSGNYNPGSTIKPLDGVAILKEGVVTADRTLYSPGYLLVPNQYDPSKPTKYMDWRSQGAIDLSAAIAQSSDVYFYVTVGGSPAMTTPPINDARDYGIGGLGISKLFNWWTTFGLGKKTGIDLPGEASGFLPTPQWKLRHNGTQWLLGDSYNVAIGQGDLTVTPLQLLSYIDAIANGGKIYRPFVNASSTPYVNEDLSYLLPQIQEVQKGMRQTVTSPLGTAYTLNGLPAPTCAKTGSAQVMNNQQENALFVGYMPCNDPQIAILILIENSKEGSLNAVPIAKDVFNWYYENRMKTQ